MKENRAIHHLDLILICQHNAGLQLSPDSQQDGDWTQAAQAYLNDEEAPLFISQQLQAARGCTPSIFKESSCKCTLLFVSAWKLPIHLH